MKAALKQAIHPTMLFIFELDFKCRNERFRLNHPHNFKQSRWNHMTAACLG
jgi:hypothetical protein